MNLIQATGACNVLGEMEKKKSSLWGHDTRTVNSHQHPEKNKHLHDLGMDKKKEEEWENVHMCANVKSVFDDFRVLVLCCQFQLPLPLHVALCSHDTQISSIHRQQHHRGRKSPIADVSQALSRHHDESPEGTEKKISEQEQQSNTQLCWKLL